MDHPALPFRVRHDKLLTLGSGIVRDHTNLWFMGATYPVSDPSDYPPDLRVILSERPDSGLSHYLSLLHEGMDSGRRDLEDELAFVQHYVRVLVRTLIVPNVERQGPADHWIWQKPLTRKHPVFNWAGIHDVLVVRLTWAFHRPKIYLPASKNPIKVKDLCPDFDDGYRCVNADHYMVSTERMDMAPNPATRRGLPDGRTSKSQRWEVRSGTVVCQRAGHPLSLHIQDKYHRQGEESLNRFEHCPGCWAERLDQSGMLGRQRRGTGALSQDTAYMREIETEAWMSVWEHEQNERGQVVPSEPEPIRAWTEEDFQI